MTPPISKKRGRPAATKTVPYPIRFTGEVLSEVDEVAEMFQVSRQDVIRLSVAAGLVALRRMGMAGLTESIAGHLKEAGPAASSTERN